MLDYEKNVIKFKDPHEMLLVCDDMLLDGHVKLHPWQVEILSDFAKPSTSNKPYKCRVAFSAL